VLLRGGGGGAANTKKRTKIFLLVFAKLIIWTILPIKHKQQLKIHPQQPAIPRDQPSIETPAQKPTNETQTNPTTTPTPPSSPTSEPQTPETSQPAQPETQAPAERPPQPEQTPVISPPTETQTPVSPPIINIPALHYPFAGNIPITFAFGAQSDIEEIKKKFSEWGIVGHNGLDFGLTSGSEVFPCDSGKVIQSGDNGDFGTSIIIQHSWGQSLYAHLSETRVKVDDEIQVNKVIGLSGSSGAAFGEHLHFAIKPNNPDLSNGYLGFIDPAPYLSLPSQKEETIQEVQNPPTDEQNPPEQQPDQEQSKPEEVQQPSVDEIPPPIQYEPEKPDEQSQPPKITQSPQTPQPPDEEIQKQVDEKLKTELDLRRQKANQARQTKREEHLMQIEKLIEEKKQINNQDVCDLLHVSQSTATNYLTDLVKRGTIKPNGKGKATTYSY